MQRYSVVDTGDVICAVEYIEAWADSIEEGSRYIDSNDFVERLRRVAAALTHQVRTYPEA